jgi:hypothetical protein
MQDNNWEMKHTAIIFAFVLLFLSSIMNMLGDADAAANATLSAIFFLLFGIYYEIRGE